MLLVSAVVYIAGAVIVIVSVFVAAVFVAHVIHVNACCYHFFPPLSLLYAVLFSAAVFVHAFVLVVAAVFELLLL